MLPEDLRQLQHVVRDVDRYLSERLMDVSLEEFTLAILNWPLSYQPFQILSFLFLGFLDSVGDGILCLKPSYESVWRFKNNGARNDKLDSVDTLDLQSQAVAPYRIPFESIEREIDRGHLYAAVINILSDEDSFGVDFSGRHQYSAATTAGVTDRFAFALSNHFRHQIRDALGSQELTSLTIGDCSFKEITEYIAFRLFHCDDELPQELAH